MLPYLFLCFVTLPLLLTFSGSEDDNEIEKLIRNGDKRAFDLLMKRYQRIVTFFVKKYIKNTEDVEDVVAIVFTNAWRSLYRMREENINFIAWLSRISQNACVDFIRTSENSKNKASTNSGNISMDNPQNATSTERIISDNIPSLNPEEIVIAQETKNNIADCLQKLPEKQQEALKLLYHTNENPAEIARILGISPNAVGSRIKNAYKNMKTCMEKKNVS